MKNTRSPHEGWGKGMAWCHSTRNRRTAAAELRYKSGLAWYQRLVRFMPSIAVA